MAVGVISTFCLPGYAPGSAPDFFCLAKRNRGKKKRPHCPCPAAKLRATCDARSCGGTVELAADSVGVFRSDNHSEHDDDAGAYCAAPAHRRPCASRHGQKGGKRL